MLELYGKVELSEYQNESMYELILAKAYESSFKFALEVPCFYDICDEISWEISASSARRFTLDGYGFSFCKSDVTDMGFIKAALDEGYYHYVNFEGEVVNDCQNIIYDWE